MSSDENLQLTPEFVKKQATSVVDNLLPLKSRHKYLKAYENFLKWRSSKGVKSFSESVLLVYFQELSTHMQPPTLWSIYSMLKATINTKHDIQINTYHKLITFMKRFSEGHKPKKSKVLTTNDIETFLNEAPDYSFLLMKVVLIFGLNGACRGNELLSLTVENVQKHSEELLLVVLPDTKTKIERSFVIKGEHKKIVEKYQALRPSDYNNNRFFVQYRNGKCVRQVIGKNKLSSIPGDIARFLKLDNPEMYTGHCFRRTSATILADSGADLTLLKRHGGWKSDRVAESYIEESIENKSKISNKLTNNIKLRPASPLPRCSYNIKPRPASPLPGCSYNIKPRPASPLPGCSYNIKPRPASPSPGCSSDIKPRPASTLPGSPIKKGPSFRPSLENISIQNPLTSEDTPEFFQHEKNLPHFDDIISDSSCNRPDSQRIPSSNINNSIQNSQPVNTQVNKTRISLPNKTINLTFENCSNITLNF